MEAMRSSLTIISASSWSLLRILTGFNISKTPEEDTNAVGMRITKDIIRI